jgi:hypothetical protein
MMTSSNGTYSVNNKAKSMAKKPSEEKTVPIYITKHIYLQSIYVFVLSRSFSFLHNKTHLFYITKHNYLESIYVLKTERARTEEKTERARTRR